jgi:GNAT superfamily N-acetyltransferase
MLLGVTGTPPTRIAEAADDARLVEVLAEAFADDAALAHALPMNARNRSARLRAFFALEVARSRRTGGAWTTADGAGAAVWYPPGHWPPTAWESLRQTPAALRIFGRHSARSAQILGVLQQHHPVQPHWYLAYLAARRSRQGSGVGGALLAAVLDRCDAEGAPAYLEASNARNRGLYLRHGFADRDPLTLPRGGPTVFPMWRDPR